MENQAIHDLLIGKKIIIYGAGRIGRRIFSSLNLRGYKIEFFWDRNAKIDDTIEGVPVFKNDPNSISFKERSKYIIFVTISAKEVSREMAGRLTRWGYTAIHDREIINSIIYRTCEIAVANGTFVFDLKTCHHCSVPKENNDSSCNIFEGYLGRSNTSGLAIAKVGLLVSNRCNLTCKGCNHLIDLKEPGDNLEFTPDELLGDLRRIVEVTDLINRVTVVGGEAFLHPKLYEIIERILELPRIGYVEIITSGTIKPRDPRLWELMANKRIIVQISGYGTEISEALGRNVEYFISELEKHAVSYDYMHSLQWFNFGDFSQRSYSREEHYNVYRTCCSVSNDIFKGKLWKCSRSAVGTHQGRLADYPNDYVDLRKYSGENLRRELNRFLDNEYPSACMQCNGASASVVIPAGVQMVRLRRS